MTSERFCVEMVGHATLRVQAGGSTLVTDPWLEGPIACRSEFHYPPLVHDPAALAAETDAIYISHVHPDHFHAPSLTRFPRHVPIYIGEYGPKDFRDAIAALGFHPIEVPFGETVAVAGTPLRLTIIAHDEIDSAAYDSAAVIATPTRTIFENNDCHLDPATYARVATRFAIDYAFLGYSPASFHPIAFEMPETEKARLLAADADRKYAGFVDAATALAPRLAIPFASGARFLHPDALWKNVVFNDPAEAVRRLDGTGVAGASMDPGDRIAEDGTIARHGGVAPPDVAAYAHQERTRVLAASASPAPARPDLLDQLRDAILRRWHDAAALRAELAPYRIAVRVQGRVEGACWFDFGRPTGSMYHVGPTTTYDMRYTYPADALQEWLDGLVSWDELHFATGVSVHQVRYARPFHRLLRHELLAG